MDRFGDLPKLLRVDFPKNQVQSQSCEQQLQDGFELVFESAQGKGKWLKNAQFSNSMCNFQKMPNAN
jgi:hypothetical protein